MRKSTISQVYSHYAQSPSVHGIVLALVAAYISFHREEYMWFALPVVFITFTFRCIIFEILLMIHVIQHKMGHWVWYHRVHPGIYLGSIPMEAMGHADAIVSLKITRVLGIMQDYELVAGTMAGRPVSSDIWKKRDVDFMQIRSDDFVPPSFDILEEGAELIHETLQNKGQIYVHCKSGIGRSASLVIAYLIKYRGLGAVEAHRSVKSIRPQIIGTRSRQYTNLVKFEEHIRTENL